MKSIHLPLSFQFRENRTDGSAHFENCFGLNQQLCLVRSEANGVTSHPRLDPIKLLALEWQLDVTTYV